MGSTERDTDGKSALEQIRKEIDATDSQILALVNQRLGLCTQIGILKKASSASVYDAQREQAVIERLQSENTGPLSASQLASIWTKLFAISRALQHTPGI